MEAQNEQELIILAQKGNDEAFKELLNINFNKSKLVIQKHFNLSKHNLEDIMQNTSIKIWQHLKEYDTYNNFYNWFFTLFKNEAVRFLKKKNIIDSNELSNIALESEESDINDERISAKSVDFILQETARTFLEKKEKIQEYQKLIDNLFQNLSKNHREIIQMILIDGRTYKDVANTLQLPVGSVMSRLFYAKKESQKIINEYSKSLLA